MTLDEKIACLGTDTSIPRLKVRSFGSSEGIHGVVQREPRPGRNPIFTTQFPQPPGMGETWDPALVQQAAAVEGAEARYITEQPRYNRSILMLWGPQADLARDPRWGRSEEVYGEDPFFNGTMVVNFIKGLQGDDPNHWQAAALLKHFLANSNENLRTKSNSVFDQRLFWEYYSVPFRMGFVEQARRPRRHGQLQRLERHPHGRQPHPEIHRGRQMGRRRPQLRRRSRQAPLDRPQALSQTRKPQSSPALHAGINQFLEPVERRGPPLRSRKALSPKSELDGLLRRKFVISAQTRPARPRPGVHRTAHPNRPPQTASRQPAFPASANQHTEVATQTTGPEPWDSRKESRQSPRRSLSESVVLLKNENNALPLDRKSDLKSIAVIGPLADSVHWDWYGGTPRPTRSRRSTASRQPSAPTFASTTPPAKPTRPPSPPPATQTSP